MRNLGISNSLSRRNGRVLNLNGLSAKALLSFGILALLVIALGLTACSRSKPRTKETKFSKRVIPMGQRVPKGGGRYKVGNPYKIAGRWYHPRENKRYDKKGIASWYGDLFHGRYTANGEIYDMNALTAAHPTLPMPTYAQVTNLQNGRSIVVRINDRGPYAHDRVIDLSKRSAKVLGIHRAGTGRVRVRYLGKAPLNGNDSYERQVLASQPWARVAHNGAPKIYAKPVAEAVNRGAKPMALARANDPMTVGTVPAPTRKPPTQRVARAASPRTAAIPRTTSAARPNRRMVFVQAGSFRSELNADNVRRRLQGLGTVQVYPAEVNGTIWYRVRVGPFRERHQANEALQRVVEAGSTGARIVGN